MADEGAKTYTQADIDEMMAGLKAKNKELLDAERKAAAALKNYDGVDPAEYKALKDAAADAERKKAAAEGDFKSLEKQLIDRHQAELGQRDTRITQLSAALERRLVDADAAAAIAEAKGSVKGLLPHVRPHIKVVEVDGEFVAQVVDSRGQPRIADGKGTPMSIADLVNELRGDQELARLYEGSGSSGGGATRTGAGALGPGIVAADGQSFLANLAGIRKGEVKIAGVS